ncbi:proton-coupled folate transporter-like [Arctopsyche grandis]|uniref:proton-coupled folate transporter-like n=1 Tax=Arctopsyche grandis TaxID=121162 RepID=UPI00406D797C
MDSQELAEENFNLHQDEMNKSTNKIKPDILNSNITLEPMWFGVTLSVAMGIFSYKNLFLEKACLVDLGFSKDACFKSQGPDKAAIEMETQKIVSSLLVGSSFMSGFVTSIIFVFLGPWSDSSGRRKPLIILPIIGMMCSSATLVVLQGFPTISTVWVIYAEVIPLAFTGNFTLLVMASFSYLGDICFKTGKCPTTMMGINSGFISLFMIIGCGLGPYIFRSIGYVGMFTMSFVLETSSLVYALYKIEDIHISEKNPRLFDLNLPLQAVKCVFKKREGNKRKIIILMIIVPCTNSMIDVAEMSLNYLFLRNKFSWTELEYGYYLALKLGVHATGTFLIVLILKRKLNMKDQNIGILSALSQFVGSLLFMFSPNPTFIYMSNLLTLFSKGAMIVERPVLNKQIKANEQGKINCVTTVCEKIISFIFTPLANLIYSYTLYYLPSSYTFISVIAAIFQIICFYCVRNSIIHT